MQILAKTLKNKSGRTATLLEDGATLRLDTGEKKIFDLQIPAVGYWAFFKDQGGGVAQVPGETLVMLRDSAIYLRSRYHVSDPKLDALATSFDGVVLLAGEVDDGYAKQAPANFHNLEIFGETNPAAESLYKKWRARQEHLFEIDPISSITALERQVDYLTGVVAALLPDDKTLTAFLEVGSANADTVTKALAFKRGLREAQQGYNENKV